MRPLPSKQLYAGSIPAGSVRGQMIKRTIHSWFYGLILGTIAIGIRLVRGWPRILVGKVLPPTKKLWGVAFRGSLWILAGKVPAMYSKAELLDVASELAMRTRDVRGLLLFDSGYPENEFLDRVIRIKEGLETQPEWITTQPEWITDLVESKKSIELSEAERVALIAAIKELRENRPEYREESASTKRSIENIKRMKRAGNFDLPKPTKPTTSPAELKSTSTFGSSTESELRLLKKALESE